MIVHKVINTLGCFPRSYLNLCSAKLSTMVMPIDPLSSLMLALTPSPLLLPQPKITLLEDGIVFSKDRVVVFYYKDGIVFSKDRVIVFYHKDGIAHYTY